MASLYTSFGTRKALGRRYAIDPEVLIEAERLQQEYNLVPGREARALQASQIATQADQFNRNFALQEDQVNQAGKAGMINSGISGVGTVLTGYALGKQAGLWGTNAVTPAVTPAAENVINMNPVTSGGKTFFEAAPEGMNGSGTYTFGSGGNSVNPALVDSPEAAGMGAGGSTATTSSGGPTVGGAGTVLAYVAAADMVRQSQGQLDRPYGERGAWNKFASAPVTGGVPALGEAVGMGESNYFMKGPNRLARGEEKLVGEPLDKAFSGDIGGSLDAFYKAALDAPRDVWNASIGAATGGVLDTWLCTATDKYVGTSADQKKAMRKLRRFARKNHKAWLNAYLVDGPALVEAIKKDEKDLQAFYSGLRDSLVVPVVDLVVAGKMGSAFDLYKQITVNLCKKYAPEIDTDVKEVSANG